MGAMEGDTKRGGCTVRVMFSPGKNNSSVKLFIDSTKQVKTGHLIKHERKTIDITKLTSFRIQIIIIILLTIGIGVP